jgi:hypothetical protein
MAVPAQAMAPAPMSAASSPPLSYGAAPRPFAVAGGPPPELDELEQGLASEGSPPPAPFLARVPPSRKKSDAHGKSETPAIGVTSYLVQLAELARGLLAEVKGSAAAPAIRLLRQRLVQWIEDVRSVSGEGGNEDLASAVEVQVERLGTALAAPETLVTEVTAIAAELAALAAGAPPPPAKKKSRLAFWK